MATSPRAFDSLLGQRATFRIRRFGPAGAFLEHAASGDDRDQTTLLLLGPEIPEGAREGDELAAFVYLDSEGRPLGTTRSPKLMLGQVGFLTVNACTEVGAFVDWGLPKDLLVPFAEQTSELLVGARHPIGLYVDSSGRLAGTMRVSEMLQVGTRRLAPDEWVDGEAWRDDPAIGLFVIIRKTAVGLVPRDEPHSMARGQAGRFRVTHVHGDGKIELSLRGHAHTELDADAERVLAELLGDDPPEVGDGSAPEQIRSLFGLSKKAFKRAVGRLLKRRLVELDENGRLRARRPDTR